MIDIHSHILPGIDDGPQTMEESIALARIYEKAGFTQVIATPHCIPGTSWNLSVDRVKELVVKVNRRFAAERIELEVLTGMEIGMDPSIGKLLKQGRLLTLAESAYVLMEVPFQQVPLNWEEIVFDVITSGYQIILAHPERCSQVLSEPALFEKMIETGCFTQVNMGSLLGYSGSKIANFTQTVIQKGYVHCLATDTHDAEYRNAGLMAKGLQLLKSWGDDTRTDILVKTNPKRILQSKKLETFQMDPMGRKTKGIKRFFSWAQS